MKKLLKYFCLCLAFLLRIACEKLPVNFLAQTIGPLVIHLSWDRQLLPGYVISYKENDRPPWISLAPLLPKSARDRYYQFRRADPCFSYEFRLQGSVKPQGNRTRHSHYFTFAERETLLQSVQRARFTIQRFVPAEIPTELKALKPVVTENEYNATSDSVQAKVSWLFQINASHPFIWPSHDSFKVFPFVHNMDCFTEHTAPLPSVHRINESSTTFQIHFSAPYFQPVIKYGYVCQILFIFQPEVSVCGRSFPLEDDLGRNSALIELSCHETRLLPCSHSASLTGEPGPNCHPDSVTAETLPDRQGTIIEWDFLSTPIKKQIQKTKFTIRQPKQYYIRYGVSEIPQIPDSKSYSHHRPITTEIGREEIVGTRSRVTLPISFQDDTEYRISICAVFSQIRQGIKWEEIPTYPITFAEQSFQYLDDTKCNYTQTPLACPTPAEQCVNSVGEFNWRPIVITGSLFTIANFVLLAMSCWLYGHGRHQAAKQEDPQPLA